MKQLKNNLIVFKHKLIVENSRDIMIFFDAYGKITDCNAKAIIELGYGDDIYSTRIYEIFKKAFYYEGKHLETNKKFLITEEETIAYRKNQTCFPVELKVAIVNEKQLFVGLCTATNISSTKEILREVKSLKNEIKSFNQINNEFTANITHELRTPVNGIMGLSDNLLETELNQSQSYDVNLIKHCCNNMNTIINNLLDYAKISNHKLLIEQREFSFQEFINHIIDLNIKKINEKGLKLIVNISKDIPDRIIGDEYRLSQILNNLVSNAVKFTITGHIALEVNKISQTKQSMELFFVLIDTGIGISLEEKDKLFKSFSQVDGSIARRFGGTGLGLSICKMLVDAMHGSIAVDSEKNKGSTFSFSVRLGVPQNMQEESLVIETGNRQINFEDSGESNFDVVLGNSGLTEMEDLRQLLQEENISTVEKPKNISLMMEVIKNFPQTLERMIICIEMENWDKAEELASHINKLIPRDHGEIAKDTFRLLLAVRKQNHDTSMDILNRIKISLSEVIISHGN
ncbi:MAG: ATP-binding protein [Mobilitalea sp.]